MDSFNKGEEKASLFSSPAATLASISFSRRSEVIPMMPFRGVRISWETLAKKADLSWSASTAFALSARS